MTTSSDKVDFSRLRYEIRKHWWWFIASFAAMMAIAAVYMLKNNPEFKFHADIMIEQEEGGGMGGGMMQMMKQFSMGSFGGGSVDDEMAVLQSRSLLCEESTSWDCSMTTRVLTECASCRSTASRPLNCQRMLTSTRFKVGRHSRLICAQTARLTSR